MADADNHTGIDLDALEEGATCAGGSHEGDTGVVVPSFGHWVVDDNGALLRRTLGRDGKEVIAPVTSTPPVVVADLMRRGARLRDIRPSVDVFKTMSPAALRATAKTPDRDHLCGPAWLFVRPM